MVVTVVVAAPLEAHAPTPPEAVSLTVNAAGKLTLGRAHTTETFLLGDTAEAAQKAQHSRNGGESKALTARTCMIANHGSLEDPVGCACLSMRGCKRKVAGIL